MPSPSSVRAKPKSTNLLYDFYRLFGRKLLLLMDEGEQVLALDVLHGDELHPVRFAQVVNADHIPMRYLMRQQQLLLEAIDNALVARQVGPDDFDRNRAVQFAVGRLINRTHATLPENLDDLVALGEEHARFQSRPIRIHEGYGSSIGFVPRRRGGRTQRNVDHRRGVRRIANEGRSIGGQIRVGRRRGSF
jgi:hypothetical protein